MFLKKQIQFTSVKPMFFETFVVGVHFQFISVSTLPVYSDMIFVREILVGNNFLKNVF